MSKKYIKILISFLLITVLFLISFSFDKKISEEKEILKLENSTSLIKENKVEEIKSIKPEILAEKSKNEINITLEVLGQTYKISAPEKSSVYNVMNILKNQEKNNFTFNYKKYPSIGIFIDEINGVLGGQRSYWIYYVNGVEASVGVSSYILKDGDSVLWIQE